MSDRSDRAIMMILAVGIALPLLGWVVGPYIGISPPWYPSIVAPILIAVGAIVIAVIAWIIFGRTE